MYVCCDEKHFFEEPRLYIEKHGLETPPYETFYGCPECGGDFEEAFPCVKCGELHLASDLWGGYYCNECFDDLWTSDNHHKYCEQMDEDDKHIFAAWLFESGEAL